MANAEPDVLDTFHAVATAESHKPGATLWAALRDALARDMKLRDAAREQREARLTAPPDPTAAPAPAPAPAPAAAAPPPAPAVAVRTVRGSDSSPPVRSSDIAIEAFDMPGDGPDVVLTGPQRIIEAGLTASFAAAKPDPGNIHQQRANEWNQMREALRAAFAELFLQLGSDPLDRA